MGDGEVEEGVEGGWFIDEGEGVGRVLGVREGRGCGGGCG